jgi:hypothetical protein
MLFALDPRERRAMSVARLVQKRMPMRSTVSFRIVNRVRASRSTWMPYLASAGGMS